MTFVPVNRLWYGMPSWTNLPALAPAGSTFTIDATGEKVAMLGRFWNKDRATKLIDKVGFRFATVVKAGGSALTVSLQNVDAATGPPYQPDGTQDQTVAIANANAAFVSNTWIMTGSLDSQRSVAFGELVAVVVEYDVSGRLSSDSVQIYGLSNAGASQVPLESGVSHFTASWAAGGSTSPNVIFECSDGTFATIEGTLPHSATTNVIGLNSGATPDEVALAFTMPFACKIDGLAFALNVGANADFDIVLYQGTSALQTVSVDSNAIAAAAAGRPLEITIPETALIAGTQYYAVVKPTTANSLTVYTATVSAAGHFQAWPGESGWGYSTRTDAGSWAATTATQRPFGGIRLSAIDIPTGVIGG